MGTSPEFGTGRIAEAHQPFATSLPTKRSGLRRRPDPVGKTFNITGTVTVNFTATVVAEDIDAVSDKSWNDFEDVELENPNSVYSFVDYEVTDVDEDEDDDDTDEDD